MPYSQTQRVEMKQRQAGAIAAAARINDEAGAAGMTSEQKKAYDAAMAEATNIAAQVDRMDQINAAEAEMAAEMRQTAPELLEPLNVDGPALIQNVTSEDALLAEGETYLQEQLGTARDLGDLNPEGAPSSQVRPWTRCERLAATAAYRDAYWRAQVMGDNRGLKLLHEVTAGLRTDLAVDADASAGIFVVPLQFSNRLIKAMDRENVLAQMATTIPVRQAQALGVRKRISGANTYTRGSELQTPNPDESLKYGGKELTPRDWCAEIVLSRNLMMQSAFGIEGEAIREVQRDIGEGKEDEFALGNGVGGPLGIWFPSADGISTARDVVVGNTSNPEFDGLKDAKWGQHRYLGRGRKQWIADVEFFKRTDKITSDTGELIWRTSVRDGEPDTLLGLPFRICEACPSTFAAGMYVGMLADMSHYWIAIAIGMTMQRLTELHARSNRVGFIFRGKDDAMPILEEPFARLKLADS